MGDLDPFYGLGEYGFHIYRILEKDEEGDEEQSLDHRCFLKFLVVAISNYICN